MAPPPIPPEILNDQAWKQKPFEFFEDFLYFVGHSDPQLSVVFVPYEEYPTTAGGWKKKQIYRAFIKSTTTTWAQVYFQNGSKAKFQYYPLRLISKTYESCVALADTYDDNEDYHRIVTRKPVTPKKPPPLPADHTFLLPYPHRPVAPAARAPAAAPPPAPSPLPAAAGSPARVHVAPPISQDGSERSDLVSPDITRGPRERRVSSSSEEYELEIDVKEQTLKKLSEVSLSCFKASRSMVHYLLMQDLLGFEEYNSHVMSYYFQYLSDIKEGRFAELTSFKIENLRRGGKHVKPAKSTDRWTCKVCPNNPTVYQGNRAWYRHVYACHIIGGQGSTCIHTYCDTRSPAQLLDVEAYPNRVPFIGDTRTDLRIHFLMDHPHQPLPVHYCAIPSDENYEAIILNEKLIKRLVKGTFGDETDMGTKAAHAAAQRKYREKKKTAAGQLAENAAAVTIQAAANANMSSSSEEESPRPRRNTKRARTK